MYSSPTHLLFPFNRCLISIELSLRCHVCDLCSEFEEDQTKTAWTIGISDRQTDRQTDIHSSDFMSVRCHALLWTDIELYYVRQQCPIAFQLLGRVALVRGVAVYSHQTFPWTICRSVSRCVGLSLRQSVQCIMEKRRIGSEYRLAS